MRKTIKLGIIIPGQKKVVYYEYVLTKTMQEDRDRYGFIDPKRRLTRVNNKKWAFSRKTGKFTEIKS
jgi:hypothetical protein